MYKIKSHSYFLKIVVIWTEIGIEHFHSQILFLYILPKLWIASVRHMRMHIRTDILIIQLAI